MGFPLADGSPGQCDPAGDGPRQGPCCSPKGFCGNTEKHCKCGTCVDYSKITETLKPEPDTRETSKLVQTKARETVQTRSGDIEGSRVVSEEGVTHYKFHGMSVHAHVLSPWNYGHIQGAIAQSGTMLYYKGLKTSEEREEKFAKHAAEKLCSESVLDQSVLECLQSVDAKSLNEKLSLKVDEYFSLSSATPFEWRPVIDNYAENPFLPLDPLEAMKTGTFNRIPFISGTVKNEGALLVGVFASQGQREQLEEHWASYGPPLILSDSSNTQFSPGESLLANI